MSAFNGSGTFVISGVGLPYVTATVISSTVANQLNTDLATGLSNCLTKDGQTVPINNIPMGGFRLTGLGAPVAPGDALVWGQPATVSDPFNITHNQNATTSGSVNNNDPGNAAQAQWYVNTGTSVAQFGINSNAFISTGLLITGSAYLLASTNLVIGTSHPTAAVIFGTNNSEQMRLDSRGNLGIGVYPPIWGLTTRAISIGLTASLAGNTSTGGLALSSNSYSPVGGGNINLITGPSSQFDIGSDGTFYWYMAASAAAGAVTPYAQKMLLDTTGGLRINTSSDVWIAGEKLSVLGTVGAIKYACANDETSGAYFVGTAGSFLGRDTTTGRILLYSAQSSVQCACISGGAQLTSGATSWAAASDDTEKTGYAPFASAITKLNTIKVGTGRYLVDDPLFSRSFASAQDVQAVLPEAVDTDPMTGKLVLRLTELIPLIIAGMKEVDTRLTAGGL